MQRLVARAFACASFCVSSRFRVALFQGSAFFSACWTAWAYPRRPGRVRFSRVGERGYFSVEFWLTAQYFEQGLKLGGGKVAELFHVVVLSNDFSHPRFFPIVPKSSVPEYVYLSWCDP